MSCLEIDNLKLSELSIEKKDQFICKNQLKFKKKILANNIEADLICIEYSDKIFISITTTRKFGSLISVQSENIGDGFIYKVNNLFGKEETILEVFCRSLFEKLKKNNSLEKTLLVSIAVERETLNNLNFFKTIEKALVNFYKQLII